MENMEKFMEKVVESISHERVQKSSNPVILFSGCPAFCWTPYNSTFYSWNVLNGKVDVLTSKVCRFIIIIIILGIQTGVHHCILPQLRVH